MQDSDKPKYQILKEELINRINSMELNPGDKIMSENELSEQYGISRHTVRRALSDMVNEGWLYKLQGKGTFVSSNIIDIAKNKKTIAVMISYINDYIFPSIISGIDKVLSPLGVSILLFCTDNLYEKERQSLENIRNQKIDALIVEPTKGYFPNPNMEFYRELQEKGIPILFIHADYKELGASYIVQDDELAGLIATKHLIKLGHRNIGGIFKSDYQQGHLRYSGFTKALIEESIQLSQSNVAWFEDFEEFEKQESKVYIDTLRLLDTCTAIVCYNDQIAQKVLDIVRKYEKIVPQDVSIVSFDDSQMAVASEVKLTTISHPKEKLGEEAAKVILKMIDNNGKKVTEIMKPDLVIRNSTRSLI